MLQKMTAKPVKRLNSTGGAKTQLKSFGRTCSPIQQLGFSEQMPGLAMPSS
jgi:hypothetical protein